MPLLSLSPLTRCPTLYALLALSISNPLAAQNSPADIFAAVVAIESQVPADARTADSLGTQRQGSGVLIDTDGLVVTIGYLIMEAEQVEATLADGQTLPLEVVAYDHNSGFGLLRFIQDVDLTPLQLGDSTDLKTTDQVLVVSAGGDDAVRPAYVVSRRPFAGYWEYLLEDAVFTSPPHPQFGGAALVGPEGQLLGIGSLIVRDAMRDGDEELPGNMFLPVNLLKDSLAELLSEGRSGPERPWLGIYSEEHRGHLFITRVAEDSPAENAGLEPNSIILAVAGTPVSNLADFYRALWALGDSGVDVSLNILQEGGKLVDVTLQSQDRHQWLHLRPSH